MPNTKTSSANSTFGNLNFRGTKHRNTRTVPPETLDTADPHTSENTYCTWRPKDLAGRCRNTGNTTQPCEHVIASPAFAQ